MAKQTVVKVTAGTHKKASAAAAELDVPLQEYADAAVAYFAERGLNPLSDRVREGVQILTQLQKMGDRVFGFMQEQERTLWMTMFETQVRALLEASVTRRLTEQLISTTREEFQQEHQRNNDDIERRLQEIMQAVIRPGQSGKKSQNQAG
jgi:signal recognition particle GTPase